MGILANLMPGVRAIRAPLAAGLLLLLSLWIAFEAQVPERPTDGIWASLERLQPLVSAVGTIGLIAFAAYVLGSLYLVAVPALPWPKLFVKLGPRRLAGRYWSGRAVRPPDRTGRPRGSRFELAFSPLHREVPAGAENPRHLLPDAVELDRVLDRSEWGMRAFLLPPMSKDGEERLARYVRARVTLLARPEDREHVDRFIKVKDAVHIAIGMAVGALVAIAFAFAISDSRIRTNTVLANGIAAGLVPLQ